MCHNIITKQTLDWAVWKNTAMLSDENSVLQVLCGEKHHHGFGRSKIYT